MKKSVFVLCAALSAVLVSGPLSAEETLLSRSGTITAARLSESFTVQIPGDSWMRIRAYSFSFDPVVSVNLPGESAGSDSSAGVSGSPGTVHAAGMDLFPRSGGKAEIFIGPDRRHGTQREGHYLIHITAGRINRLTPPLAPGGAGTQRGAAEARSGSPETRSGAPEARPSVYRGSLSAAVDSIDQAGRLVQWHSVELGAGERIRISLDSDFDNYLYARLPDGTMLEDDDTEGSNARLSVTMRTPGRLFIGAASYGTEEGPFTLTIAHADPLESITPGVVRTGFLGTAADSPAADRPAAAGSSASGPAVPTVHEFELRVRENTMYEMELRGEFDTVAAVHFPGGIHLENDDGPDMGTDSLLVFFAEADETVVLQVRSYETDEGGSYTVVVREIAVHRRYSDRLTDQSARDISGKYYNLHPLRAVTGERYTVQMRSQDFDAYIGIQNPRGIMIAEDDDSAGGTDAAVSLVITESGTYQIVATTFGPEEPGGSYEVLIMKD